MMDFALLAGLPLVSALLSLSSSTVAATVSVVTVVVAAICSVEGVAEVETDEDGGGSAQVIWKRSRVRRPFRSVILRERFTCKSK